jgi:hypothetical protein
LNPFIQNYEDHQRRWAKGTYLEALRANVTKSAREAGALPPSNWRCWVSLNPENDGTAIWFEKKFNIPDSGQWDSESVFSVAVFDSAGEDELMPSPGIIVFECTPLEEVGDEIERWVTLCPFASAVGHDAFLIIENTEYWMTALDCETSSKACPPIGILCPPFWSFAGQKTIGLLQTIVRVWYIWYLAPFRLILRSESLTFLADQQIRGRRRSGKPPHLPADVYDQGPRWQIQGSSQNATTRCNREACGAAYFGGYGSFDD